MTSLVEKINNLTSEQRAKILEKTNQDMNKIIEKAKLLSGGGE